MASRGMRDLRMGGSGFRGVVGRVMSQLPVQEAPQAVAPPIATTPAPQVAMAPQKRAMPMPTPQGQKRLMMNNEPRLGSVPSPYSRPMASRRIYGRIR